MAVTHGTTTRNNLCAQVATDVGGSGKVVIKDGSNNVLATLPMASTPFGAPSGGSMTAGSMTTANATGTGTAATFEVQNGSSVKIFGGTVAESGGDLTITNTDINTGDPVSASSLVYTAPA